MRKTTTAEKTSTVKTSEAPAKETVTKDEVYGNQKRNCRNTGQKANRKTEKE